MASAEVRALAVGLVAIGAVVAGVTFWHASHPDVPVVAKLTEAVKDVAEPKPAPPPKPAAAPTQQKSADLGTAPTAPMPPAATSEPPHFDVVRVEPSGEAVVAGKADPNSRVALVASGKVVAAAPSDAGGQFVIIPPTFAPGNYDLTLRQSLGSGKYKDSTQTVAVGVPAKRGDQVVVALAEPGKPTRLMSSPPQAPAPGVANAPPPAKAPEAAAPAPTKPEVAVAPPAEIKPAQSLAIHSAELENGNGFYASGVAAPGTRVQLYLNGAHLAEVTAGPDGQWSVRIKKGLTGGHYAVRADALDGDKVTARAEVPFDVPVAMAEAPKPEAPPARLADAAPEPPAAPTPSEAAGAAPDAVPPSISPPEAAAPPAAAEAVPAPRPDIAAAAKAASAKAPGEAPPALAVAPPTPPAERPVAPAADMSISPAKPASAPPAIAAAPPRVAPPQQAVAPPGPPATARATPASPAVAPAKAAPSANAVVEQVETALVIRGDNLWNISRAKLGAGTRYTQIYAANATQIRDPKLIYPGQVFVMPQQ